MKSILFALVMLFSLSAQADKVKCVKELKKAGHMAIFARSYCKQKHDDEAITCVKTLGELGHPKMFARKYCLLDSTPSYVYCMKELKRAKHWDNKSRKFCLNNSEQVTVSCVVDLAANGHTNGATRRFCNNTKLILNASNCANRLKDAGHGQIPARRFCKKNPSEAEIVCAVDLAKGSLNWAARRYCLNNDND